MKTTKFVLNFLVNYYFHSHFEMFINVLPAGPAWFIAQINAIVIKSILFYQYLSFSQLITHSHAAILFEAMKPFVLFLLLAPFSIFSILPICQPIVLGNNSINLQFLKLFGSIQKSFDFATLIDLAILHILSWVITIHFVINLPIQRGSLLLQVAF